MGETPAEVKATYRELAIACEDARHALMFVTTHQAGLSEPVRRSANAAWSTLNKLRLRVDLEQVDAIPIHPSPGACGGCPGFEMGAAPPLGECVPQGVKRASYQRATDDGGCRS